MKQRNRKLMRRGQDAGKARAWTRGRNARTTMPRTQGVRETAGDRAWYTREPALPAGRVLVGKLIRMAK